MGLYRRSVQLLALKGKYEAKRLEILELGIKSIRKAGEMLKLNVPLDATGSIGND